MTDELRAISEFQASIAATGKANTLSDASQEYCTALATELANNEEKSKLLMRCFRENPSLNCTTPTDAVVGFIRRWMEFSNDFIGDISRAALRHEIRHKFPLQVGHYLMGIVEIDRGIATIQEVRDPDRIALAHVVQRTYAAMRWLDDPTVPAPPTAAALTSGEAIKALLAVRAWLNERAMAISPQPAAPDNVKERPAPRAATDAAKVAYNQFRAVLGDKPSLMKAPMREVYAEVDRAAAIAGVELPTFETWSRYVRAGKQEFEPNPDSAD